MATRSPPEATQTPVEAMARALIIGVLPALEAAVRGGLTCPDAKAEAWDRSWQDWRARYGDEVTIRAREVLRQVGSSEILTPYGRDHFLARYPVEATQLRPPVEAIAPPVEGIGARLRQAWGSFWRAPPASNA